MKFIPSALVLIILLMMIKVAMPLVIKSIVINWFESQGLTTQIGEIDLSLLEGGLVSIIFLEKMRGVEGLCWVN